MVPHGVGEGRRGANDVAARAEAAALPEHYGRKKKGAGSGPGGLARPAWPFGAGWLARPTWPLRAGGLAQPLGRLARKLKKISFPIKLNF
jgi:hypothetical protein